MYATWTFNYTQSVGSINGYAAYTGTQDVITWMTVPSYGSVYKLNSKSMTGNTLVFNGNTASVKANISCNIAINVDLSCSAIDTWGWYLFMVAVYKNGTEVTKLLHKGYDTDYQDGNRYQYCKTTYNISANTGDIIEIRVEGGNWDSGDRRTSYSGTVTFTGTPNG